MRRISTLFFSTFLLAGFLNAQELQTTEPCHAEIEFREQARKNPQLLIEREAYEKELAKILAANPDAYKRKSSAPLVIPVVFHVVHEYGGENISRAQILDCIRIMNEDFSLTNADTNKIPSGFKSLAGNANVEFRLAQKDPNGNCTDGIVRINNPITNFTRNEVKAISYWPSDKYLNAWTVKWIDPQNANQAPGTYVVGFAQFPGGTAATDGVVLRHESVGKMGTSNGTYRTPTHEVGHWLNLRHIWGDATCGNDQVADTPEHEKANQSNCPAYPHVSNCAGNGPNGDMFTNYMDYTLSSCQNMFSKGQATRMNAALTNASWTRKNLHTSLNLTATGTDGSPAQTCVPKADFYAPLTTICAGTVITFTDASYNGIPTSWTWTLPGGTPSTSGDQHPTVTYANPGVYDVELRVGNASGNSTAAVKTGYIYVSSPTAALGSSYSESFESATFPPNPDYIITDFNGSQWERTTAAATTGSASARVNVYSGGNTRCQRESMILPSMDFTGMTGIVFTFKYAYAQTTLASAGREKLMVRISQDCGKTWLTRFTRSDSALNTRGTSISSNFVPTASQWEEISINMAPFANKSNVRILFEFTSGKYSNNIYIDDINITSVVGIKQEVAAGLGFTLFPNPASGSSTAKFYLTETQPVDLKVYDVVGKQVANLVESRLPAGEHLYEINKQRALPSGVYIVKLKVDQGELTQKLIVK